MVRSTSPILPTRAVWDGISSVTTFQMERPNHVYRGAQPIIGYHDCTIVCNVPSAVIGFGGRGCRAVASRGPGTSLRLQQRRTQLRAHSHSYGRAQPRSSLPFFRFFGVPGYFNAIPLLFPYPESCHSFVLAMIPVPAMTHVIARTRHP